MGSWESKNYYQILGVPQDAPVERIKEAYRDIARVYHPDSNFYSDLVKEPLSSEHHEVFKRITAAYNTLINPEKRSRYDELLPKGLVDWDDEHEQSEIVRPAASVRSAPPEAHDGSPFARTAAAIDREAVIRMMTQRKEAAERAARRGALAASLIPIFCGISIGTIFGLVAYFFFFKSH